MNPIINNLPNILVFIVLTLFVFILIREVICWYFKINERVQLQKDILAELVKMNGRRTGETQRDQTLREIMEVSGGDGISSGAGGIGLKY